MATLRAYAPQGSKVLMATPIYNGFYYDIMGSKLVANESLMHYANGRYEIDWDDLERRMTPDTESDASSAIRRIPSGRAWTKDELTRYGELCLKHNIKVLADEIHCDFITKGSKYTPFSTLDDKTIVANSITFKSGSKSFSLAAMKCAWFFTTNPEMYKAVSFWNRADLITLGMMAEQAAYAGGEEWLNQCVDYIDGNQALRQRLHQEEHPADQGRATSRKAPIWRGWMSPGWPTKSARENGGRGEPRSRSLSAC